MTPGGPTASPQRFGTTAQSSCRFGRIATFRPMTAAAATRTPTATKSGGHWTRSATSATHGASASGSKARLKAGTGGRARGTGCGSGCGSGHEAPRGASVARRRGPVRRRILGRLITPSPCRCLLNGRDDGPPGGRVAPPRRPPALASRGTRPSWRASLLAGLPRRVHLAQGDREPPRRGQGAPQAPHCDGGRYNPRGRRNKGCFVLGRAPWALHPHGDLEAADLGGHSPHLPPRAVVALLLDDDGRG